MQIGALGSISQSPVSQTAKANISNKQGFAHILSGLGQPKTSGERELSTSQDTLMLSSEELKEIVQLLQASDLTEIESGSAIIEQLLGEGNADVSKLILDELQLDEAELKSAIKGFLQGLKVEKNDGNKLQTGEELSELLEKLPDMDLNEALMSVLGLLPAVNIDQTTFTTDQQGIQLAKTFKLLELLLHYEKPNENNLQMEKLLQKTTDQLEAILNGNSSNSKAELLDKVFAPLVKELNQSEEIKSSTDGNYNTRFNPSGQMHSLSFLSKQDQLVLLQEQSGQMVTKDQLIKQFESILAKSQFITSGGSQKLFIKLYPEHLGALRIELTQQDSLLTAKILTTTANAKDLLESQIQSLKQAFVSQNLQVEKIEIAQQFQQERFFNRDPQKEPEQQQPGQQDEKQESGGNQSLAASFEEVLLNVEA